MNSQKKNQKGYFCKRQGPGWYMVFSWLWPGACFQLDLLSWNRNKNSPKVMNAKKYDSKRQNDGYKTQNFYKNGNFDFFGHLSRNQIGQTVTTSILAIPHVFSKLLLLFYSIESSYPIKLYIWWHLAIEPGLCLNYNPIHICWEQYSLSPLQCWKKLEKAQVLHCSRDKKYF